MNQNRGCYTSIILYSFSQRTNQTESIDNNNNYNIIIVYYVDELVRSRFSLLYIVINYNNII